MYTLQKHAKRMCGQLEYRAHSKPAFVKFNALTIFDMIRPSRKSSMFPVSRPTLRNRADPVTFYAFRNKIKSVPTDPLRMYDFFIILYLKVYVTILLR